MSPTIIDLQWEDPSSSDLEQFTSGLPLHIGSREDNELVIKSSFISGQHLVIEETDDHTIQIRDLGSQNGVVLNGKQITSATLESGDAIELGPYVFLVNFRNQDAEKTSDDMPTMAFQMPLDDQLTTVPPKASDDMSTVAMDIKQVLATGIRDIGVKVPPPEEEIETPPVDFPPAIFDNAIVSVDELKQLDFPIEEKIYLTLGGGIGSFTWVDTLIISGVNRYDIRAIGIDDKPYGKYKRLCENSQIPEHERLRSDSGSTPDNIWGWPGYAIREISQTFQSGNVSEAAELTWKIFGEPTLSDSYTPRAGNVYASMEREMDRIGWSTIWRFGSIRAIRKTDDGRYVIAYSVSQKDQETPYRFAIGKYVHVSLGYPAFRLLPDLTAYRETYEEFKQVVNAYESHDHVYEQLKENGGTVLIRGRGIVASRILQRLYESRTENENISVVHLMRSTNTEGKTWHFSKRTVENHWEMQPYNWPKSAFGGIHREILEDADDDMRKAYMADWGGTTTADRRDWREIIQQGLDDGWYTIHFGTVQTVSRDDDQIVTNVIGRGNQPNFDLKTDYIIDCTGLISNLDSNPVLADLMETYELPRNPLGRFQITDHFELAEMKNDDGKMYAAGVMTLGGPFAPVDSFLGLQYAALRSLDDLIENNAPYVKTINGWRSFTQWVKWARGVQP